MEGEAKVLGKGVNSSVVGHFRGGFVRIMRILSGCVVQYIHRYITKMCQGVPNLSCMIKICPICIDALLDVLAHFTLHSTIAT